MIISTLMYTLEYGLVFNKEDTLDTRFFTYLVFNVNLLMYGLQREREKKKNASLRVERGRRSEFVFVVALSIGNGIGRIDKR